MAWFRDYRLLLWKNFLLQKRRPISTFFELFVPLIIMLILLTLRITTIMPKQDHEHRWAPIKINNKLPINASKSGHWKIAFTPNDTFHFSVMQNFQRYLNAQVQPFASEKDLTDTIINDEGLDPKNQTLLCGIVFDSLQTDKNIKYRIRFPSSLRSDSNYKLKFFPQKWFTEFVFPFSFQGIGPRNMNKSEGGPPNYYGEGFLSVQRALDYALIKTVSGNKIDLDSYETRFQRFPYPSRLLDDFIMVIQGTLPLLLVLSLVYSALSIVRNIVHEKERKLKESMKMMGLRNWIHWLAWFTKCFVFLLIPIVLITIIMCVEFGSGNGKMLSKSNGVIVFIFLILYVISMITFCFFLSTLFSKANIAAAGAGIIWFLSYVPYSFVFPYYDTLSTTSKVFASLDFQLGMALGANLIGRFEGQGAGIQWWNINKGVTVDTTFTFAQVLIMFVLDSVIHCLLTWYIEAVFPGDFGIPKKWYFPFTKSYWCPSAGGTDQEDSSLLENDTLNQMHSEQDGFIEKDPTDLTPGVQIRNLRKEFKTEAGTKVAVNMSLNIYESEITALLGHNGAGKTTTISMLTGLIPPTSGTATINGCDIRRNILGAQKSLGICPQHNVLFDTLTVEEHLWFFTALKGVTDTKLIRDEIDRMIDAIGLADKRNVQSKKLSGGMKRKLSVGMALVGNSKIVLLDEPTSGMDVSARRFTWDLLQRERRDRTILLTTHYMDEADVLGDRIAIMSEGELQCCGSSLFLKKKYGVGYHMVMVKDPLCDVAQVAHLIYKHVPVATLESNVGLELSFILPNEYLSSFSGLFSEIEERHEELGISSFGASITTLEEVFLKVCENSHVPSKRTENLFRQLSKTSNDEPVSEQPLPPPDLIPDTVIRSPNKKHLKTFVDFPSSEKNVSSEQHVAKNTGWRLLWQQWYAMFLKRYYNTRRNKMSVLSQLITPGFFVMLALIVVKVMPKATDSPPRVLDLKMFGESFVAVHNQPNSSYNVTFYKEFVESQGSYIENTTGLSVVDHLLKLEYEDLARFNLDHLIAIETSEKQTKTEVLLWFNNEAYHSLPVSWNAFANSLLHAAGSAQTITATNAPLPTTAQQSIQDHNIDPNAFQIGFSLVFSMSFLASSFIVFLVQERVSGAKHVQLVSGVRPVCYWTSAFTWDMINFLLPLALIVVLFEAFQQIQFLGVRIFYVVIILLFYAWAVIPFMYVFSFAFRVPSTAYTRMTILNVITGLVTLLVVNILSIPALNLVSIANTLKTVFLLILPNYCLGQGVVDIFNNYEYQRIYNEALTLCETIGQKQFPHFPPSVIHKMCVKKIVQLFASQQMSVTFQTNYLAWANPGIGRYLVCMACQGVVFFTIVLCLEYKLFSKVFSLCRTTSKKPDYNKSSDGEPAAILDNDVIAEKQNVSVRSKNEDVLQMVGLNKVYGSKLGKQVVAVDDLYLGVQHGECFGLLGQNGAGKTSTFKMLTGDERISGGCAYIDGYNAATQTTQVRQRIGYCPQFDALIDLMTGREILTMYARLRGVPEPHIPWVVQSVARDLNVDQYLDKITKTYSGGNKRKLSTAVALVGDPLLIFLDEPSSGMDPVARRMLWNSLAEVTSRGKTIVITSHFMEECEALCTRLAIMVNGQFKCLGSTQHLKTKFGDAYTLIARVEGETDALKEFVETSFPGSVLKDEHQGYLHYQIPEGSWARLFGTMESAKEQYGIEDYSVSQTTLEQVFLNFTRLQDVEG